MAISDRKQRLAEIRRELAALSSRLDIQRAVVTKQLGLLEDLQLSGNLWHAYEASVARQLTAENSGLSAVVEAEQLEQELLRAVADSFYRGA